MDIDTVTILADGVTVTAGPTSESIPIPLTSAGQVARVVRLKASGNLFVKFGQADATCTTANMLMNDNDSALMLTVSGCRRIAYLAQSPGALLNITPIEF